MENKDIRWIQRFANYQKALSQLTNAVELSESRALTELEQQGLIQSFEYTHELAWKCLKDYLNYQGYTEIYGSRDASREAFKLALVNDGDVWMNMIKSRNETSHTYNEDTVNEIVESIVSEYFHAFKALETKLIELKNKEQSE